MPESADAVAHRSLVLAVSAGALIGTLGGMVGLGGAEFRLPLLLGVFGFAALQAVIVNKAMSLVVVTVSIPARLLGVPFDQVASHWLVAVNLLVGSLLGAWMGAGWATRMKSSTLSRILAVLLGLIAIILTATHLGRLPDPNLDGVTRFVVGVIAGFGIGIVAALMGIAGGEFLIPAIVILFGVDIKIAGSLSLLVSLPTMVVAFFRYSKDQTFGVLRANVPFILAMAGGSIGGALLGGLLLGVVSSGFLIPLLAALLVISAVRVWRHV